MRTLAQVTARVNSLIKTVEPGLLAIINNLSAEDTHVAALVDLEDASAVRVASSEST